MENKVRKSLGLLTEDSIGENKEVTRRKFMRDSAMVAAGLGSVIGGCKGKEEEKEPNAVESGTPEAFYSSQD